MARSIEAIKERVTDPGKQDFINSLTDAEILMITANTFPYDQEKYDKRREVMSLDPKERSAEQQAFLDREHMIHIVRVIYFRNLVDWASAGANETESTIMEFIDDPTFVDYPDVLTSNSEEAQAVRSAIKIEYQENHAREMHDIERYGAEILGARIDESGYAQVLIIHNQVQYNSYDQNTFNFSQDELDIPPSVTIGYLKQNPNTAFRGKPGQVYVAMKAPYPGRHGADAFIEVNLPDKDFKIEEDNSKEPDPSGKKLNYRIEE